MSDLIFENPRLVGIYDAFDGERGDLKNYLAIATELGSKSVFDIGCGTGCLALLFEKNGFAVTGVEPAAASLAAAMQKPGADRIRWILGDAKKAPGNSFDLAVMTGNVAQVFLTDESWDENLKAIRNALRHSGHLVFETRDPARRDWLEWTPEKTLLKKEVPGVGLVTGWCEVTKVSGAFVTFRLTYEFAADGEVLVSDSTLRFREKTELIASLERNGFAVREIRDAPDRPGKEFVFIARAV